MSKINKYGVDELRRDFGTDDSCVEFLFHAIHTDECHCGGKYTKLYGRRQYQCGRCRFQIAPTAGTIFHKSDTPLTKWFEAIFRFSNAKSGYSAKQLERDLNVTYKTAWRMLKLIRQALKQDSNLLSGDVEMDEMYFGGRRRAGRGNRRQKEVMENKSVVVGAVERKGIVRAEVSPNTRASAMGAFLEKNVNPITSRLLTDTSDRYDNVARGYDRHMVNHSKKEYVRGDIHTNTIESFWGHVKRSVRGTHKVVSRKYLQSYLDGFVFHYNNRSNDNLRFSALLGALLQSVR